jgi:hypothetical protein
MNLICFNVVAYKTCIAHMRACVVPFIYIYILLRLIKGLDFFYKQFVFNILACFHHGNVRETLSC